MLTLIWMGFLVVRFEVEGENYSPELLPKITP